MLVGDVDRHGDDLAAAIDAARDGCELVDQEVAGDDARTVLGERRAMV